jgi:hypothetical protein
MDNNKYLCSYKQLKNIPIFPPRKCKYNSDLKISQNLNLPTVQIVNSSCISMAHNFIQMNDKTINPVVVSTINRDFSSENALTLENINDKDFMLRSNFYKIIEKYNSFPLCEGDVLHIKNLFFFRDAHYQVNNGSFGISTIVASFIDKPELIDDNMTTDNYFDVLQTVEAIFQCASIAGHNILILNDVGVKYYDIPVSDIVEILNICILRYSAYFKFIIIAFPVSNSTDRQNLAVMQNDIIKTQNILCEDNDQMNDNKINNDQINNNQMNGNQMNNTQINGNQINGNQINGNQINNNQMNNNQMNGNQMNSTQMNSTQMNSNQMNGNQMNGGQMNGNQMNGSHMNGGQMNGGQMNGNQNGISCQSHH